jgi:hypothetical protein
MQEPLRKFQQSILPLVVFGTLWFLLIKNLSLYWAADPQYSFGWFGPLLCAYLFLTCWLSRPLTEPASWAAANGFLDCGLSMSTHLVKQTLDGRLTVQVPVLMVEKALGDLNVQLNSGEASKRDGCLKPAR